MVVSHVGILRYAVAATPGWYTVTLDTPFVYNGTDNLLVAVDRNTGSFVLSTYDFYAFSTVGNVSLERHVDYTDISPASPGTGFTRAYLPNTEFGYY